MVGIQIVLKNVHLQVFFVHLVCFYLFNEKFRSNYLIVVTDDTQIILEVFIAI